MMRGGYREIQEVTVSQAAAHEADVDAAGVAVLLELDGRGTKVASAVATLLKWQ